MKKITLIALLFVFLNLLPSLYSAVAQTEEQPAQQPPVDGDTTPQNTATIPQTTVNQNQGTSTAKSNNICIKVGTPESGEPAVCNQPAANFTAVVGAGGFVHYCQNSSPAWNPALAQCSLQSSGCGPTSLAMILSTFGAVCNGATCDPSVVDQIMKDNNQRLSDCNSAAASGVVQSSWFKNLGMEAAPAVFNGSFNFEAAKQRINEGFLIVGSASNAPSCNCNHIFVIQDVDPASRSLVIRDPVCGGSNQEVDFSEKYSNAARNGSLNWLYAVPVRKRAVGAAQQGAE